MNFRIHIIFFVLLATLISSCKDTYTGSYVENQAPETFLTVEKINREGEFRLSSQINISWWGNDSDGYIIGYEYAINDTSEDAWTFTTKTDSTFILPITPGNSQDDVLFKIRAIDNDNAKDPVGARLIYPIVNSDPTVSLNLSEIPPDTLYSVTSFGWTVYDPDGLGNIESTEVAVNDTINGWVTIPIPEGEDRVFINLEVDNTSPGPKTASVFLGRSFASTVGLEVSGLEVGALNTFYVRTTDAAGAVSEMDSVSWFIKQRTSNTLFLNDYSASNSSTVQSFHLDLLQQNGINPDVWIINDGEVTQGKVSISEAFPSTLDPTLTRTIDDWDHIYWISEDIDRNITYALEIGSRFFNNGGTMFANIPMKRISQSDEIFNFLPVDSIGVLSSGQADFQLNGQTDVPPQFRVNATDTSTVVLKTSRRMTSLYPLKPASGANLLYKTDFKVRTVLGTTLDYTKDEAVAIENVEQNVIYFSLELPNVDANGNLADMIDELLIGRLNFTKDTP